MRLRILLVLAIGGLAVVGEDDPLPLARDVRTKRFTTAVVCATCHANEDDAGAMRDGRGRPIAPHDLWQSSMMANAARDPFFRAAMAADVVAAPDRQREIEARCLHCHAPMASTEARRAGRPGIAFADVDNDEDHAADDVAALARDSVSCTVCHQIDPDNLGTKESFSGGFVIGDDREIYGPHGGQWGLPMKRMVQYWPQRGEHVLSSELCATCHTDVHAGGVVELASFQEWRNSAWPAEGKTCQACHAPTTSAGGAGIRTRIARSHLGDLPQVDPREPYGRHIFVGGNTLVPAMLRDHAAELHVRAPRASFDATIALAREQIRERTATVVVEEATPGVDVLTVVVRVTNLAGHKFPTGHASRRAWLRLRVRDAAGIVIHASGEHDEQGRLVGPDGAVLASETAGGPVAPHHATVSSPRDVQIYEAVLAGADGKPVFSALRAARFLKDNRLLPRGWSPKHEDAAATAPIGTDGDASFAAGGDLVVYEVPLQGELNGFSVEATLLWQPISPRYAAELFRTDHPEIRRFRRMYEAADRSPEVVARASAHYRPQ